MIRLYSDHDARLLLSFLRQSNFYTLEAAYRVCETAGLVREQVCMCVYVCVCVCVTFSFLTLCHCCPVRCIY